MSGMRRWPPCFSIRALSLLALSRCAAGLDECPHFYTFRSEGTAAPEVMGEYELMAGYGAAGADSFVVYQKCGSTGDGPFLYQYLEYSNWRIGYDYTKADAQITSGETHAACPSGVSRWYDFDGAGWREVSDLELAVGTPGTSCQAAASSKAAEHPLKHTYVRTGIGDCEDDAGNLPDSYHKSATDMTFHTCQARCDADPLCVGFTSRHFEKCTVWAPGGSGVPAAADSDWSFEPGTGASSVTRGTDGELSEAKETDLEARVFCMTKSHDLTAANVEGGGFFWVLWVVGPLMFLCISGIVMAVMTGRSFGGRRRRGAEGGGGSKPGGGLLADRDTVASPFQMSLPASRPSGDF